MPSWFRAPKSVSVALRFGLALALLAGAAPVPLAAQPAVPAARETLDTAREHLKNAEYDQAILLLKESIAETREQPQGMEEWLRDLHLLLIKSYVVRSNALRFEPQGLESSHLFLKEARNYTLELLQTPGLEDTRPDPGGDYPPEMFALFNEVVAEIFGTFRITKLDPPGAVAILDGDTLGVMPDGSLGADNLAAGAQHLLVLHADGYEDWTEELTIYPNATLQRPYALEKNKGFLWYASRGVLVAGGVAALVLGLVGGDDEPPPEPLPGPPAPPAATQP